MMVAALSAHGANLQSIAATTLIDMVVNVVRSRAVLNEAGDLEVALVAAIMGQHHMLLAAIREAA